MTTEFLLTSLIVILIPGTGVLYTIAIGLGRGFKVSIAAALGCTLGIIPSATTSIIGLSAIFHTSALAFLIIKYLGAAYLLYMAWDILQDKSELNFTENPKPGSLMKVTLNGALLNILNPKLSLFFLAFFPQFINTHASNATQSMLLLASIFMLLTFIIFVTYGAGASLIRNYIISRPNILTWIKRVFAGTFGFLGLKLAMSEN